MNKNDQLEQLRRLLLNPGLKSNLYLVDTDLTDDDIEWFARTTEGFSYYKGSLVPSRDCSHFELFVITLSSECESDEIKDLRNSYLAKSTENRDAVLFSLLALIMRKLSAEKKTIIHISGAFDLTSFAHDDLSRIQETISNCINPVIIVNKKKVVDSLIKTVSLREKNGDLIMTERKTILHISYKHDPAYEDAMNSIKTGLEKNSILYSIDEYDIMYCDNLDDYEKEIGASDRVLMFVIPSYLKSLDCMFEMTQMFKNGNVRERIFPLVDMGGIPRNGDGLTQIKDYWQGEKVRKSELIKTEPGGSSFVIEEIKKIDDIILTLNDFWFFICRDFTGDFKKLIENDAASLIEELYKLLPKTNEVIDEKFVPSGDTQPADTRMVVQNGEKSVYIEKNIGTIIFN